MAIAARDTARELDERFGGVCELGELARLCGVSRRALLRSPEEAGVPVLSVGRKRAVVRELAERALGLDRAEVALEIQRNDAAMRQLENRADGTRKSVGEFAAESSARARTALHAAGASSSRGSTSRRLISRQMTIFRTRTSCRLPDRWGSPYPPCRL